MKLSASILSGAASAASDTRLALAIVAAVQPGSMIDMVTGPAYRVLSKSASADGVRICIAQRGGMSRSVDAAALSELHPTSPAIRRFASVLHRIFAASMDIGKYINLAITEAGYPVDPTMNWNKVLGHLFKPLYRMTQDKETTEEAIYDMVVQELYVRNVLTDNFDPSHPALGQKPEAKKVSAYLNYVFKKRVSRVIEGVMAIHGTGMGGALGRQPNPGLDIKDSEGESIEFGHGDLGPSGRGQEGDYPGGEFDQREVNEFTRDYKAHLKSALHDSGAVNAEASAFAILADLSAQGATPKELLYELRNSDLRMHNDEPLSPGMCRTYVKRWRADVKDFITKKPAQKTEGELSKDWSATPLGRKVLDMIYRFDPELKRPQKAESPSSALNLAQAEPEPEQQERIAAVKSAAAAPPSSSNMLAVPRKPDDENDASVAAALASFAVERLEAPTPKVAFGEPGPIGAAPGAATTTPVVSPKPPAPTNPNVQQQANQSAAQGQAAAPQTAPAPEGDYQQPPQNTVPQAHATQVPEIPGAKTITASTEVTMAASVAAPKKVAGDSLLKSRKAPRKVAAGVVKFARLRRVAASQGPEAEAAFRELAASYRKVAFALNTLRENLDLVSASKDASLKEKTAATAKYSAEFKRLAAESPEAIESAIQEIYTQTDDIATAVENLADHLGVSVAPGDETPATEGAVSDPSAELGDEDVTEPALGRGSSNIRV